LKRTSPSHFGADFYKRPIVTIPIPLRISNKKQLLLINKVIMQEEFVSLNLETFSIVGGVLMTKLANKK